MKTVYLYGPIAGLTYAEAEDWRTWMRRELREYDIDAVSPLRFKNALEHRGKLTGHGRDYGDLGVLTSGPAILARDKFDVLRADMLVGNFLGADRVSIGSMFEQAWAHQLHKPIAVAVDDDSHPHDHLFFNQTVDFRVSSLDALRDVVLAVLT